MARRPLDQSQSFKEQGGAATMDPNPVLRWLTSKVMAYLSRAETLAGKRHKLEKQRLAQGQPHRVEYFHQLDDGYSHLAAQILPALAERYDIELVCHLVGGPTGHNVAEPELLLALSRYDASHVAAHYGLGFPQCDSGPGNGMLELAEAILAAQDDARFSDCAAAVGEALWSGDEASLRALADRHGVAKPEAMAQRRAEGEERRALLAHYSGAMFYYAGEWYWGVDRLYHLEKRLRELGADRQPGQPMLVPRPALEAGPLRDDGRLTLEIYPSLRSPYTAMSFDRTVQLARDTGVTLVVRPVLPMVMRGVPATRQKGMYIFMDAAREAREANVPYGNFYDPIGEPARRAYSLYPWACEQGKGSELISSFLGCAFARGVNTNRSRGLKTVVEGAGLKWEEAKTHLGDSGWDQLLESNRQAMYAAGLWGVPSFRLLDEGGEPVLALWGQDRLWLFSREIQRLLRVRSEA